MRTLLPLLMTVLTTSCVSPQAKAAALLVVDNERLIEITTVVQGPNILYDANNLLTLSKENTKPVYILLNSPGGSVYAGLQFINAMRVAQSRGVEIHCIVPGMAMSMAFQFFLECDHRYALPYSLLLWHPVRISGNVTLTPVDAQSLADSLLQAEEDLLPGILGKLTDAGMSERDVMYHYLMETTWTADNLAAKTRGFLTVIDDVEGISSIWNVDKMMGKHSIPATAPTHRIWEEIDIQYLRQQQTPAPTPTEPPAPRDCHSCHNKKPHGGVIK